MNEMQIPMTLSKLFKKIDSDERAKRSTGAAGNTTLRIGKQLDLAKEDLVVKKSGLESF